VAFCGAGKINNRTLDAKNIPHLKFLITYPMLNWPLWGAVALPHKQVKLRAQAPDDSPEIVSLRN